MKAYSKMKQYLPQVNDSSTIKNLGNLYLSYLSIYSSEPHKSSRIFSNGLNIITVGNYSMTTNYDFNFVNYCMQKFVDTFNILLPEYNKLMRHMSDND